MKILYSYFAGVIDSDGTIGIRRYGNGTGNVHYRPRIEVVNMSYDMVKLLQKTFAGSISYELNRWDTSKKVKIYKWSVNGKFCTPVLKAILPYLIVKPKQAKIALKCSKRIGNKGTSWSDTFRKKENEVRHKLYLQIRFLNSGYTE